MNAPGEDLAPAALAIARVEYPSLETGAVPRRCSIAWARRRRDASAGAASAVDAAIRAFNEYLYDELGFRGNRERYDDPRNSFLNEVLEPPHGNPDQPRGRVPRSGAPGRTACRRA